MTPAACRLTLGRTGAVLCDRAELALSWRRRVVGLLDRRRLAPHDGMVFPSCRAIHTIGMRCSIDVLLVDRGWHVVAIRHGVKPWRLVGPAWRAWAAIELPEGTLARLGVVLGDVVDIRSGP